MLLPGFWKKYDSSHGRAACSFQPELRRALEQIGRGRLFHKHNELDEKELEDMLNAVTNATEIMSRRK